MIHGCLCVSPSVGSGCNIAIGTPDRRTKRVRFPVKIGDVHILWHWTEVHVLISHRRYLQRVDNEMLSLTSGFVVCADIILL